VLRFNRRAVLGAGSALAGSALVSRYGRAAAMPAAHAEGTATTMTYRVEGRLLEVCTCNILCPCWVGEDPDGGTCDSSFAWMIDQGTIEGVDVSGLALGLSVHIPGNVLEGNWQAVVYVDDRATEAQEGAMLKVWTGQLGGPISDLVALIGEVITVERATINFDVADGAGTLTIGDNVVAELAPFRGLGGVETSLHETAFSTIPGSPAFVGKASRFHRDESRHGLGNVELAGHNAIQGSFIFEA
jgi:hypothetical protein